MAISKDLLDILACPKCKGDLRLTEKEDGLICDACRLLYEIRDDTPSCSSTREKSSTEAASRRRRAIGAGQRRRRARQSGDSPFRLCLSPALHGHPRMCHPMSCV